MKEKTIAFTIIAPNYLSYARLLRNSLNEHHPEIKFILLLMGKRDIQDIGNKESFEIIDLEKIGMNNHYEFLFKYMLVEACTAIKPFVIKYLMEKYPQHNIIYFDPDIYIYNKLDFLLDKLKNHNIVLTPHILTPLQDDGRHPSEIEIMQVGCYNLGFIALRNCKETRTFVNWWKERLENYALSAPEKGLFTDQKWMDLCPSFIKNLYILRHHGYNVAYWNLHERRNFSKKNNIYFVEDIPLVFFHFSGLLLNELNLISKYQNRFVLSQFSPILKEIFETYKKNLIKADYFKTRTAPYTYSYFSNGVEIKDVIRKVYYNLPNRKRFGNPFIIDGDGSFFNWLNKPMRKNTKITNLIYSLCQLNADFHSIFSDFENNEISLIRYVQAVLKEEYGLSQEFYSHLIKEKDSTKNKIKKKLYYHIVKLSTSKLRRILKFFVSNKVYNWLKMKYERMKHALLK